MNRFRPAVGLVVAALALVVPPAIGRAASADAAITITGSVSPASLTVAAGTPVTWHNADGERHRPRSYEGPDDFDTGNIEPGDSGTVTLTVPGTYRYHDDRDRENGAYQGTIVVTAIAPPPTTPPPPGGGGGGGGTTPPAQAGVSIVNQSFSPGTVTLPLGSTVTWTNNDDRSHTVTASGGAFASGTVGVGGRYTRTFATAGTFPYFCEIHPDMRGTIAIAQAGGGAPPPAAPPPPPPAPPSAGGAGSASGARTVSIVDFGFTPSSLAARVGDTITFVNSGQASHTASAVGGAFDSGTLRSGASYRATLTTEGTIAYVCNIHPAMRGTITVAAAPPGSAAATAAAAAAAATANTTTTTAEEAAAPPTAEVDVRDFSFTPPLATVAAGGEVTWTLTGEAPHSITADDGAFDSGVLDPGATFAYRFGEPGTYTYSCLVHPTMKGTINVVEATAAVEAAGTAGSQSVSTGGGGVQLPPLLWGALGGASILAATGFLLLAARRIVAAA